VKLGAAAIAIAAIFPAKSVVAEISSTTIASVIDDAKLRDACGGVDGGLDKVARVLASRRIDGLAALDQSALTNVLRDNGAPYVWPRAWIASAADETSLDAALTKWLATEHTSGTRRCGVARGKNKSGETVIAAVEVDALANLSSLPMHSHVGSWLTVESHLLVSASDARAVVIEPDGTTRRLLSSFSDGRVLARFAPDRSGTFIVQVVADVEGGPRPVLEARVLADSPSSAIATNETADEAACVTTNTDASVMCMIQSFRRENRLDSFARDARLDAVAKAHASAMMLTKNLAHDAGDGDPVARIENADLSARIVGENVAHAESALGAHRSLYASPSHRDNLLSREFDRIGVAALTDADGTVWVVEEFAAGLK
jgi:uncharacterized protein YkwD